jgi:hypothetical protein
MKHPSLVPRKGGAKTIDPKTFTGEIDLRVEFDKLVLGIGEKLRHGHPMILRRMRRQENGEPVFCTCSIKDPHRQGKRDCVYCQGEGFLWDEEWHIGYAMYTSSEGGKSDTYVRMPPGNIKGDYKLFFLRYDVGIKYGDKIVEVRLDEEGKVQLSSTKNSFIRKEIHKPQTIAEMRSDNGRLEYYAVYCRAEDAIRNTSPNE